MDPVTSRAAALPPSPAPERHALTYTGAIGTLRFPDACARCGAPPAGTLRVEKMFRHVDSESPTRYEFAAVVAPFCASCLAQHARDLTPVDPKVTRKLTLTYGLKILPYLFPIGVAVFLLTKITPRILGAIGAPGPSWGVWLGLGILAFFAVVLWSFVQLIRDARHLLIADYQGDPNDTHVRYVRAPFGGHFIIPGPPTSVLAAVDFSDDGSQLFDGEQHTFRFTDPVYAAQFAAANAGRRWDPGSPRARRTARMRTVVVVVFVVAGVGMWIYDLFS